MPRKPINQTGRKFGALTAVSFTRVGYWVCRCDCGRAKEVCIHSAVAGRVSSCGCATRKLISKAMTTHGGSYKKIYGIHEQMLARCYNKNNPRYKAYGGRGIKVCARWRKFANFYADMGDRPPGKSLDRINVNIGYSPLNCRWAPIQAQSNNKQNTLWVTFKGRRRSIADWCRTFGLNPGTLYQRYHAGIRGKELFSETKIVSLSRGRGKVASKSKNSTIS